MDPWDMFIPGEGPIAVDVIELMEGMKTLIIHITSQTLETPKGPPTDKQSGIGTFARNTASARSADSLAYDHVFAIVMDVSERVKYRTEQCGQADYFRQPAVHAWQGIIPGSTGATT